MMPPRQNGQLREALDAAYGIGGSDDADPLIDLTLPRQRWWREMAARARPVSRQAIRWTWGIAGGVVTGVLVALVTAYLLSH